MSGSSTLNVLSGGVATMIGSLPHRDAREAAEFSLVTCPDLPCVPTVPRRSPAEGMIAQAVVGIRGISLGQYGSLLVDTSLVDPLAAVRTDTNNDSFGGLRSFLARMTDHSGPIKWQFTGPVTVGQALMRLGVPAHLAFDVAVRAVRHHVRVVADTIGSALPDCPQVVVLDEPDLGDLYDETFPIAPDTAIDLMSGALAVVERDALVGLHSCADVPLSPLLAAGPQILSVPVSERITESAIELTRFVNGGGWVAWGVVPTDGPIGTTSERWWKKLASVWCSLTEAGCDPLKLRRQALVTPVCGLALHSHDSAAIIMRHVAEVGERVRTQALSAQFSVGA